MAAMLINRGRIVAFCAAAVATGMCVASAGAAVGPTSNGKYSGTIQNGGKELDIHVSPDGKSATGVVFCSKAKAGTFPRFPIVNGSFKATDKIGGTAVAVATGTVLSPTQIKVRLNLKPDSAICDGAGGTIFLKLKSS